MDKKSRDYEVCLCYRTTRGEVEDIIREKNITNLKDLCEIAKDYIAPEKGVETIDDALNGAKDIIAEQISDEAEYRKRMKILCQKEAVIVTKAAKEEKSPYEMYYEFSETIKTLPSHRILAINRGEKEEKLKSIKIIFNGESSVQVAKNMNYLVGC